MTVVITAFSVGGNEVVYIKAEAEEEGNLYIHEVTTVPLLHEMGAGQTKFIPKEKQNGPQVP